MTAFDMIVLTKSRRKFTSKWQPDFTAMYYSESTFMLMTWSYVSKFYKFW